MKVLNMTMLDGTKVDVWFSPWDHYAKHDGDSHTTIKQRINRDFTQLIYVLETPAEINDMLASTPMSRIPMEFTCSLRLCRETGKFYGCKGKLASNGFSKPSCCPDCGRLVEVVE